MLLFPDIPDTHVFDDADVVAFPPYIEISSSGAVFDDSKLYRYSLWRRFKPFCPVNRMLCVCSLNPSTADHEIDDPTVRRDLGFAKSFGFDGLVKINLFSFRATDPALMKAHPSPIGAENDYFIQWFAQNAGMFIAAWGNDGAHLNRSTEVRKLLQGTVVYHLGLNQTGEPKHPLFLKKTTQPVLWKGM